MKYNSDMAASFNDRDLVEKAGVPVPNGNMTDIAKENRIIVREISAMTNCINVHLFGNVRNGDEAKDCEPACLMDELQQTNKELKEMCELLHKICGRLGA